jgi:hypothetical protein
MLALPYHTSLKLMILDVNFRDVVVFLFFLEETHQFYQFMKK